MGFITTHDFIDNLKDILDKIENLPLGYISCSFRGDTGETDPFNPKVQENIKKAAELATLFWDNGIPVICPHKNTELKFKNHQDAQLFLNGCLKIQSMCDFLVVGENNNGSEGVKFEREFAEKIGQPIYCQTSKNQFHNDEYSYFTFWDLGKNSSGDGNFKEHLKERFCKRPKQNLAMRLVQSYLYQQFLRKNKDYGGMAIQGTGETGLVTRMWDKSCRIHQLGGFDIDTGNYVGEQKNQNEKIEDSYGDMCNYSAMALVFKTGVWGR